MADGVKPNLVSPAEGWTPFIRQNMDEIWKCIHLQGMNYYSMVKTANGSSWSERSDFKSKLYQGWFGTYIIDVKKQLFDFPNEEINSNKKQVIDQLMQIAILDQSSWLYAMGDPATFHSTSIADSVNSYSIIDQMPIEGRAAPVIFFSLNSHSDINDSSTRLSGHVGRPDKTYWQNDLGSNHPAVLSGFYIYWYNKKDQTLKIIYGTGRSFSKKDKSVLKLIPS